MNVEFINSDMVYLLLFNMLDCFDVKLFYQIKYLSRLNGSSTNIKEVIEKFKLCKLQCYESINKLEGLHIIQYNDYKKFYKFNI